MENVSLNGEFIQLRGGETYWAMDALYLAEVGKALRNRNVSDLENFIKEEIFPYAIAPFAVLTTSKEVETLKVGLRNIKKANYNQVTSTTFSTDTGLIVFVERSIFIEFLKDFDYEKLVDDLTRPINTSYWSDIASKFGKFSCAIVLSCGTKGGAEFVGSGIYWIDLAAA